MWNKLLTHYFIKTNTEISIEFILWLDHILVLQCIYFNVLQSVCLSVDLSLERPGLGIREEKLSLSYVKSGNNRRPWTRMRRGVRVQRWRSGLLSGLQFHCLKRGILYSVAPLIFVSHNSSLSLGGSRVRCVLFKEPLQQFEVQIRIDWYVMCSLYFLAYWCFQMSVGHSITAID